MIITPAIKRKEVNTSGKCNIKIRVSHNYGTRYIGTDYYLLPQHFADGKVTKDCPGYKYLQVQLDTIVLSYEKQLMDINYQAMHINRVVELLTAGYAPNDFQEYFKKFVAAKRKINDRTGDIYYNTLVKIEKFENRRPIMFEDITPGWLKQFHDQMILAGLKPNSSAIHFRNIRAVINDAIDNNIIPLNSYPFRRFKFKGAKTVKRAITIADLLRIRDFETAAPLIDHARNVFMLSFYLIGTNLTDLYYLADITSGRANFNRAKTHRPYAIKIETEAMQLIEKLRGESRTLNLSDKHSSTLRMIQQVNRGLEQIIPSVTSYAARHTWATIAKNNCGATDDEIGQALGHTKKTVTDIYIDRDPGIVDRLNRRVIDFVNKSANETKGSDWFMCSI